MQLLICAATEFEIRPTLSYLEKNGSKASVLITGVGMTATTYSLMKEISKRRPDFILQAGIAGCIDLSFPLTKTVVVGTDCIGDLGVTENGRFHSVFQMGFAKADEPPFTGGKLVNQVGHLEKSGLSIVNGVTVNEVSTDPEQIAYYRDELHAAVETMEGAALHYVALSENIPFLQLRSLSNFAGERDKSKWVTDIAIQGLNNDLIRLLSKFNS
jgi:futalosine hydrolase